MSPLGVFGLATAGRGLRCLLRYRTGVYSLLAAPQRSSRWVAPLPLLRSPPGWTQVTFNSRLRGFDPRGDTRRVMVAHRRLIPSSGAPPPGSGRVPSSRFPGPIRSWLFAWLVFAEAMAAQVGLQRVAGTCFGSPVSRLTDLHEVLAFTSNPEGTRWVGVPRRCSRGAGARGSANRSRRNASRGVCQRFVNLTARRLLP